jgi:hypothetical protein
MVPRGREVNVVAGPPDPQAFVQWFFQMDYTRYKEGAEPPEFAAVKSAIVGCLPGARGVDYDPNVPGIVVEMGEGVRLSADLVSQGYQGVLLLVGQIAYRAARLNPQFGELAPRQTPGIVLIDELDLHLHPKWQRRVVADLRRAFPLVQFVATTHSPFIIQSAAADEIRILPEGLQPSHLHTSIEDIAVEIQGLPFDDVRSSEDQQERIGELDDVTAVLADPSGASDADARRVLDRVDQIVAEHSDDPSYCAVLRIEAERLRKRVGAR